MMQLYQPTPLEQAYSLYVGQQVFGVLPGATQIQISGRDAVPFLTQSNVDRGILRSLWTVADPQTIGTLSQLHQFQLLLRLVAMAQAGLLNSSMTVDTVNSMVQQYSSQQLNLPSFSSILVPLQDQLMSTYGSYVINNNVQPVSATPSQQGGGGGGGGGFWSLSSYSSPTLTGNYGGPSPQTAAGGFGVSQGSFGTGFQQSTASSGLSSMGTTSSFGSAATSSTFGIPNTNTAAPLVPPAQQFGGEIPEGFNTAPQLPTVSVSDAFGDIVPPTDAPLPSLGEISGSVNGGGSVDQSELSGSLHPTDSNESMPNTASFQSALQTTDSFQSGPSVQSGGFQQVGDMGAASMNQGSGFNQQQLQQSDGFGGFEAPVPTTGGLKTADQSLPMATEQSDDFEGFEKSDQSAPMAMAQSDDFGGFETAEQSAPTITAQKDDFGGFETAEQSAPTTTAQKDDFGGFETAEQSAPMATSQSDDFGGFEAAATTGPRPIESDPFGGLPGSHDAPLRGFDQVPQPGAQPLEADDFGGFEDAVPASIAQGAAVSDSFGAFGGHQDASLPSMDQVSQPALQQTRSDDFGGFESAAAPISGSTVDESDPFGPIAGTQDAPLPSLDQFSQPATQQPDTDDFGGFEAAAPAQQQAEGNDFGGFEKAETPVAIVDEADPFGPIVGTQDAPLPSLDQFSQPAPQQLDANDFGGFEAAALAPQQADGDDFGGFETAEVPAAMADETDQTGPIAGSQDAPLPSPQPDADDLGGFGTAAVSAPTIDDSDPFGPIAGTQDAPLPSFQEASQPDDFGGFETATPSQLDQPNVESDPFGPIASNQDAPLPSLGQVAPLQQTESNDFGGFEAAPASADVVPDNSDPFGPIQDAPLPSLDQPVQPSSQDDSFGGFEAAGPSSTDATNDDPDLFGGFEAAPQQADADDFGGFEAATPAAPQQADADDFGGFETAEAPTPTVDEPDPFGPLAGTQDSRLPSLGQSPQATSHEDDVGGFEAAAPSATVATADDSDPFGPVAGSEDAPLPSLGQMLQPVVQDQEDDFGGFENAAPVAAADDSDLLGPIAGSIDASLPSLGQPISQADVGNDFGEFENAEPVIAGAAVDGSDPFGPLSGTHDAPLPAFGQPSEPAVQETEDSFGDFGTAAPAVADGTSAEPETNDDWGAFGSSAPAPPAAPSNEGADFGDFTTPTIAPDDSQDEFGAFDSNTTTTNVVQPPAQDDDWGGFDSGAPADSQSNGDEFGAFDSNTGVTSATLAQPPAQDDEWGAFDSTTGTETAAASAAVEPEAHGADWGALESNAGTDADAPALERQAPENVDATERANIANKDDEWGAFDSNNNATGAPAAAVAQPPPAQDDDWGAFDSGAPAPSPAPASDDGADFGDFSAPSATVTESPPAQNDNWGAFDSSAPAPPPADSTPSNDNGDDWGAFDSNDGTTKEPPATDVAQPPTAQDNDDNDDDWGDFGKATPASQGPRMDSYASSMTNDYTSASGSVDGNISSDDDEFGDFGDFEGGTTSDEHDQKPPKNNAMQDKIRAYASQLPESLLRKSGLSGEHVDLAECFEVNIGLDTNASITDPARKATVDRCLQVLGILKKKRNSKLPSYWEQLFLVVKEELEMGKELLAEASSKKRMSKAERQQIQKPLVIMLSGFTEYLRVVRSIVGTIGDLLLLDVSALLTIDTYTSTWCSLDILKIPVEIEQLWKEIEKTASALSIRSLQSKQKKDSSTSLTSIRRRVTQRIGASEQQLCELTLVPLSKQDRGTTCGMVSWQEKDFMACSANILANRCPFYVVLK
ncbi:MAG: hypothetical protein SGBAC_003281 [Bacillariaceae sp.]